MRIISGIFNRLQHYLSPINYAKKIGVTIGNDCRLINTTIGTFGSEPYLIKIGNHVTITSGVQFITHDGGVWIFREQYSDIDVIAPITIGNNVFIGINSIILPGVTIGSNTVIAAGSIVSKNIPENSIAAGIPAKVIKTKDEYFLKIKKEKLNIRNLNDKKKKLFLTNHFKK